MRGNHGLCLSGLTLVALVVTSLLPAQAHAELTFSVNLRTGVGDPAVPPYITYESPLQDTNGDGYFETVLRINLHDPSINNPFVAAVFQVRYDAEPAGSVNVNIGDSRTNNSGGGDAGTQSNDAEISIGRQETQFSKDLFVHGKDGTPVPELAHIPNFAGNGVVADLTVGNDFFAWDNHRGLSGSLTSPYLFALAGQPDSEGPVNYNIYAAFNRVIDGPYRLGSGVAQVNVTLVTQVVPEPSSIGLLGIGILGSVCYGWYRGRGQKPAVTDH